MGKRTKKELQKIKQAVHDRLEKLEQHLLKEDTDEEYIHLIRVNIKHLRAWLRLLKIEIDELDWKDMDRELRDLAKSLGSARDMQVVAATLKEFDERTVNDSEHRAIKKLRRSCNHEAAVEEINWPVLKQELMQHIKNFHKYYIDAHSIDELRRDLKCCYKTARKKGNMAFAGVHDFEKMHRLRKHVKTLNYQVSYLNKGFYKKGKSIKKHLARLGESLGKIHDLDIVRLHMQSLSGRQFNRNDRAIMGEVLERELQHLLQEAQEAFERIFSKKANQFVEFMD